MQLRVLTTDDEKEKLMEQLKKTPTLQEVVDTWEDVSSAFRDDLEAKVGRFVDEEPARYHVRIRRRGDSKGDSVLQLRSELCGVSDYAELNCCDPADPLFFRRVGNVGASVTPHKLETSPSHFSW